MHSEPTAVQAPKESSHCQLTCDRKFHGYKIVAPLGKGRFAKVWSAKYGRKKVAIKIYRRGNDNIRYYANEIKILSLLSERWPKAPGAPLHVTKYIKTFAHVEINNEYRPYIHPCIAFERAGSRLCDLISLCKKQHSTGVPEAIAKKIIKQILSGLAFIHSCSIIHADIKPENILFSKPINELSDLFTLVDGQHHENFTVVIVDFGSSSVVGNIFSRHVGTTQYISPEIVLELQYDQSTDIWSTCALAFELITGDMLFDVYKECGLTYGNEIISKSESSRDGSRSSSTSDKDTNNVSGANGESNADTNNDTSDSGSDLSGSSSASTTSDDSEDARDTNVRLLALMEKFIGRPPEAFTWGAAEYYDSAGILKGGKNTAPVSITDVLMLNYEIEYDKCRALEEFMLYGLKYIPNDRATAEQLAEHKWLTC